MTLQISPAKSDEISKIAAEKISFARIRFVIGAGRGDAKAAFFASIVMKLAIAESTGTDGIDTAATDGKTIWYYPPFIAAMSDDEVLAVFAHESLHVSNGHMARCGDRHMKKWNVAADLAINSILNDCGYSLPRPKPPSYICIPGEAPFQDFPVGLSAEDYYQMLPPAVTIFITGIGDGSSDPGGCGGIVLPGDNSQAARASSLADSRLLAAEAEQAALRTRGDLPGSLVRSVQQALKARVDWESQLAQFVDRQCKNDYSWSRPNRRHIAAGNYFAGMTGQTLGTGVILVDLSGSISQGMLDRFGGESQGILEAYDVELTIVYHDVDVQRIETWKSSDGPLCLTGGGGGGTSHKPAFKWVDENVPEPTFVVALTDGESVFPTVPDYPVLWAIVHNERFEAPFGNSVFIS